LIVHVRGPIALPMKLLWKLLWKLLALVAVLLMPFGMTAAPAAASGTQHSASMPMQHCPEQSPQHEGQAGFVECTMACAAALPAVAGPAQREPAVARIPELSSAVHHLHGLHPDTATPPPKHS
jgi:hypothetical protein